MKTNQPDSLHWDHQRCPRSLISSGDFVPRLAESWKTLITAPGENEVGDASVHKTCQLLQVQPGWMFARCSLPGHLGRRILQPYRVRYGLTWVFVGWYLGKLRHRRLHLLHLLRDQPWGAPCGGILQGITTKEMFSVCGWWQSVFLEGYCSLSTSRLRSQHLWDAKVEETHSSSGHEFTYGLKLKAGSQLVKFGSCGLNDSSPGKGGSFLHGVAGPSALPVLQFSAWKG